MANRKWRTRKNGRTLPLAALLAVLTGGVLGYLFVVRYPTTPTTAATTASRRPSLQEGDTPPTAGERRAIDKPTSPQHSH